MKISNKGQLRLDKIIDVAFELFCKQGYTSTSLSQIVALSGGSLSSVYKFFTNKQGLFAAVLDKKFQDLRAEFDEVLNLDHNGDLGEFLYKFGLIYFGLFRHPNTIAFIRVVISESYQNKELGRIFYDHIISKIAAILVQAFLDPSFKADFKFKKSDEDAKVLAFKFLALLREPFYTDALMLGEDGLLKMDEKSCQNEVRCAVEIFIKGVVG